MFSINEFSILTKISVYQLKIYDECQILYPQLENNCYSIDQVEKARQLQIMSRLGFGLNFIKLSLEKFDSSAKFEEFLFAVEKQKIDEKNLIQKQLKLIEDTCDKLILKNNYPQYKIIVNEIIEKDVISCRKTVASYEQIADIWVALSKGIVDQNVQLAHQSNATTIYHCIDDDNCEYDVEVQRDIVGVYFSKNDIIFKQNNNNLVAIIKFEGNYDILPDTTQVLAQWLCNNNYELCGPMYITYETTAEMQLNDDYTINELCYPIKKKDNINTI